MAAKRFLVVFALAGLLASTGCRAWCDRHYPCTTPVYAAPTACVPCVPCCPPGTSYSSPAAPAPSANWTQQPALTRSPCYCP